MTNNALTPSVMLATYMHAQPGVYALLLGSGVSTGAGVPTGWGVVQELVRRVAAASGGDDAAAEAAEDPEGWWARNGEGELGYSTLLEALAPTAPARQGILADFFEPTDEDRDEGVKVPSRAHHAIAQLVKRGIVRVILTTNFDHLMEQALDAAGVSPQVIARPEAVNGMAPLAHAPATVIKLHGDYKDLASRNTPDELGTYPQEWVTLLTQVFDEYGLLISGWSADWDTALVNALDGSSSRRYPLYWDSRSSKGASAQRLLKNRFGQVIECPGADELFDSLVGSIDALDRLAQPTLTTAMAVARLKRYLPDPLRRIDLHDLVMDAADEAARSIAEQPVTVDRVDGETAEAIWQSALAAVTPVTHLLTNGIWHDADSAHRTLWTDAVQRLIEIGTMRISRASAGIEDSRLWAALIAMTAAGVAATRRGHDDVLIAVATLPEGRPNMGTGHLLPAAQLLHPTRVLSGNLVMEMPRWGGATHGYPFSALLREDVRPFLQDLIPSDTDYNESFSGYEYRMSLMQEKFGEASLAYRGMGGKHIERWQWDSQTGGTFAEGAFRRAAERHAGSPWTAFLGAADLDLHLIAHREVLRSVGRSVDLF